MGLQISSLCISCYENIVNKMARQAKWLIPLIKLDHKTLKDGCFLKGISCKSRKMCFTNKFGVKNNFILPHLFFLIFFLDQLFFWKMLILTLDRKNLYSRFEIEKRSQPAFVELDFLYNISKAQQNRSRNDVVRAV